MLSSIFRRGAFAILVMVGVGVVMSLALSFVPDTSVELSTIERFRRYADIVFTFDYSRSDARRFTIPALLWDRGLNSLLLIGGGMLFVAGSGVPLGIVLAIRPESPLLGALRRIVHVLSSIPILVWAFGLFIFSGAAFRVYPNFNVLNSYGIAGQVLIYCVPILSLGLGDGILSDVVRNVRTATQDEWGKTYIRALRARRAPVMNHLCWGVAAPVFSAIANKITYLISGTIVVEVVFQINGLARLIYKSVQGPSKDYPLLLAATMLFVALTVALNLLSQTLSLATDPRLTA